jgi:hypothetical protein
LTTIYIKTNAIELFKVILWSAWSTAELNNYWVLSTSRSYGITRYAEIQCASHSLATIIAKSIIKYFINTLPIWKNWSEFIEHLKRDIETAIYWEEPWNLRMIIVKFSRYLEMVFPLPPSQTETLENLDMPF